MIPFQIAIPSHRRADILEENTMALLREAGADLSTVTIFLSDPEEVPLYEGKFPECSVVIGGDGDLTSKLNAIHYHYPKGERVLVMEDDLKRFVGKHGEKQADATHVFLRAVNEGWVEAKKTGALLWGFSSTANGFYMVQKNSTHFKCVVGYSFGFISNHLESLEVSTSHKQDYERSCLYYEHCGIILRINRFGFDTNSFRNPGGLQEGKDERHEEETKSSNYLVRRFPLLLSHNTSRKSIYPELRTKRPKAV